MSDLIDRNAVMLRVREFIGNPTYDEIMLVNDLNALPSAEPERKKGKWKKIGHWGRHYRCDQCGNTLDFDGVNTGRGDANFCPNCGSYNEGE